MCRDRACEFRVAVAARCLSVVTLCLRTICQPVQLDLSRVQSWSVAQPPHLCQIVGLQPARCGRHDVGAPAFDKTTRVTFVAVAPRYAASARFPIPVGGIDSAPPRQASLLKACLWAQRVLQRAAASGPARWHALAPLAFLRSLETQADCPAQKAQKWTKPRDGSPSSRLLVGFSFRVATSSLEIRAWAGRPERRALPISPPCPTSRSPPPAGSYSCRELQNGNPLRLAPALPVTGPGWTVPL